MAKIIIQITGEVIQRLLITGNGIDEKYKIDQGLPKDAKLVDASILHIEAKTLTGKLLDKNILNLTFETLEPDYHDGQIITLGLTVRRSTFF